MLIRYAILALSIAVLGPSPAAAQKLNYLREIIDLPELLPPPPGPDSQALKDDIAGVMFLAGNFLSAQILPLK